MKRMAKRLGLMLLLAAGTEVAANEAIIYRDTGFSGPAVNVTSANPDLGLRYNVNAIRVQSGRWELCPERNFRGRCIMVSQSSPNLFAQFGWAGPLGSMRPAGWGGGGSGGGGGQVDNPSLRGMAAEFFPRPADRGGRILACPRGQATASCAQQTANDWCRSIGWSRAAHTRIETQNRTNYLVDTLCVRG
jgi:hypothetical protein